MKLNFIISFICMVFITVPMQAKLVEASKAERLANRYVQSKRQLPTETRVSLGYTATQRQNMQRSVPVGSAVQTILQDTVYYYVFNINENEGGGFVIVSGEDVVKPILGYSENGNYDENNLPPNFAWWMEELQNQQQFRKKKDEKVSC